MTSPRLAVLGSPIQHSRSPRIHSAAYRALNLNWSYEAIELKEASFIDFMSGLDGSWLGFSVTMPLKRAAFDLGTTRDEDASAIGVANTLVKNGEGWSAYNTDVGGFIAAVQAVGLDPVGHATIVGAGATALSAALALKKMGVEALRIFARNSVQIELLQATPALQGIHIEAANLSHYLPSEERKQEKLVQTTDLWVNTLPGTVSSNLIFDAEAISRSSIFDLSYDPYPSKLVENWTQEDRPGLDGLELLVQQALLQVRLFVNGDVSAVLPRERVILDRMRSASVER